MSDDLWLLVSISIVNLLALISPGPNFVIVTQMAMQRDRAYAFMVGMGIATGSGIWGFAVTLGLSALSAALPWLQTALRLVGGIYLVWIGVRMWRSRGISARSGEQGAGRSLSSGYVRGLVTNMLNPKAAAYYASVFALFFTPTTPWWVQVTAILTMVAMSAAWHAALATVFSTAAVRDVYLKAQTAINRIAGAVIAGFGVKLLSVQ